jgi:hypothetical protein
VNCIDQLKAYLVITPNLDLPALCLVHRDTLKQRELILLLSHLGQNRFTFETEIVGLGRAATPDVLKTRNEWIEKYFNSQINEWVTVFELLVLK